MIINTVFNPYSYDELARPAIEMTNLHHQMEESYAQDDEKANTIQSLINPELDKTTYSTYQKYLNDLTQARDDLNQKGLNGPATMKRLIDTKHLYNKDIIPIATKAKFRQDQINLQREAQLKDPSIVFNIDYSKQSLDNIDLNNSNNFVSADKITDDLFKNFQVMIQGAIEVGDLKDVNGSVGNIIKKYYKGYGYGIDALKEAADPNSPVHKIFTDAYEQTMKAYGIDKWNGNNADKAREQLKYAAARSISGLIGKKEESFIEDPGAQIAYKTSLDAALAQAQNSPDTLNNPSEPDTESIIFSQDKKDLEKDLDRISLWFGKNIGKNMMVIGKGDYENFLGNYYTKSKLDASKLKAKFYEGKFDKELDKALYDYENNHKGRHITDLEFMKQLRDFYWNTTSVNQSKIDVALPGFMETMNSLTKLSGKDALDLTTGEIASVYQKGLNNNTAQAQKFLNLSYGVNHGLDSDNANIIENLIYKNNDVVKLTSAKDLDTVKNSNSQEAKQELLDAMKSKSNKFYLQYDARRNLPIVKIVNSDGKPIYYALPGRFNHLLGLNSYTAILKDPKASELNKNLALQNIVSEIDKHLVTEYNKNSPVNQESN